MDNIKGVFHMTSSFMSMVIGAIAVVLYLLAPFLEDEKQALRFRILSEVLFALMFFYIGTLAGVSYYGFMALSALFQKKIETSRTFGLAYGIIACAVTAYLNNTGLQGYLLAGSLILVFLKLDEDEMLTFTSYVDFLTALILMTYSFSVKAWVSFGFAILLMVIAAAGMVSAVKLQRGGGLRAAAAEQRAYEKKQAEEQKSTEVKPGKKHGKGKKK